LNRKFDVDKPNAFWTADITYVWTLEGWLYLAVVFDLYSRQIVGWAMGQANEKTVDLGRLSHGILAQETTSRAASSFGQGKPVRMP